MFIDVHCHLTGEEYDGVGGADAVISRARQAGTGVMICSGFDLPSSLRAAELAEKYREVYFCAGLQPEELLKCNNLRNNLTLAEATAPTKAAENDVLKAVEADLKGIEKLLAHPKCVAAGEMGLDYHFPDNPSREVQKAAFVRQLELADRAELPVVIHSRDACADTLEILREHQALLKRGGLMHCYSYSEESVRDFAALGLYFSFGGTSTFKNAKKVQSSARQIPACRILSETDSPYLTPAPFRGVFPNQPKNVVHIVENLAILRGEDVETLKNNILRNARRLFYKMKL